MKGMIFAIEGTDGAGKHTQQQLLLKSLKEKGYNVFDQSLPNYESDSSAPVRMYLKGEFGEKANCLDAHQASLLYVVDRMCTYKKNVESHYENGEIILFDRYVQSNFIHHGAKIDDENEKMKFVEWEENLEYNLCKIPKPDIVFFIEMPVEKSLELARARADYKTGEAKDIHEEDTEYMTKAYNNGIFFAKKLGWNLVHCLDNEGNLKTIEQIHEEIMQVVEEYLKNYQ